MKLFPDTQNWHLSTHIGVFIVFCIVVWFIFFFIGNLKLIPCDITCNPMVEAEQVEFLENIKLCKLNAWDAVTRSFINDCQTIYTFFSIIKPFYQLVFYNIIIVTLVSLLIYNIWHKQSRKN